jgi:response regulator NasT
VKPIREQDLVPACQIAVARYRELNVLREENKDLRQALEARKVIEKAKGILQRQHQLTEDEAFRRLRTMAMNRQKPIREIAEAIVLADEMSR